MKQIKRAVKFIISILIIQFVLHLLLTINGYFNIYDIVYNKSVFDNEDSKVSDFYGKLYANTENKTVYSTKVLPENSLNYSYLLDTVTYLYNKNDLKYIVLSLPYSEAELLNYYMTDDTENISEYLKTVSNIEYHSAEFNDFVVDILNLTSYQDDKIEFIGILPEENYENTCLYIKLLISQINNINLSERIEKYLFDETKEPEQYLDSLSTNFTNNNSLYKEYLLKNYFTFEFTLNNYKNQSQNAEADNFIGIYNHNLRSKYLIIDDMNITQRIIEENSLLDKRTYLYAPLYQNAVGMDREYIYSYDVDVYPSDEPQIIYYDNRIIKYFEKYREFVYKINKKQFNSYDTDISDYFVIIKNSPQMTYSE